MQIPVNRPHAPVNDMLRDGMHQTAVHEGVAPYLPNSLDGGLPLVTDAEHGGYVNVPVHVEGQKIRASPVSFDDHYTQATLFYNSMSPVEKAHIIQAFTFELGKCYESFVRERMLESLANVDADLCAKVAAGLGLPTPPGEPVAEAGASPALSQIATTPGPIDGRVVGVIAADGTDLAGVGKLRTAIEGAGAVLRVIAPNGGTISKGRHTEIVERTFLTTRSVEFDAVVVAGGAGALVDPRVIVLLQEAYRHCKAIAAWGDGVDLLTAAGLDPEAVGVIVSDSSTTASRKQLIAAMGLHRAWDRFPVLV
jgi:catalase